MRAVFLLLSLSVLAFGDGGTVLFHSADGPFDVTVFSKGDAVRVGLNDLSVMVQKHEGQGTVMNANVLLHLSRSEGGNITRVTALATHAKATNKMMYAASMNAPSAGVWRLAVDISADGQNGRVGNNIDVKPPTPPVATYWPYIAMVPFAGIAFLINRWLRKRMGAGRSR